MRRAHDTFIFRLAYDSGLRIAPIEWSVLLYGDLCHTLQMEAVNYNLDRPRALAGFLQELQLALTHHEGLPIISRITSNLTPITALDRINGKIYFDISFSYKKIPEPDWSANYRV